MKLVGEMKLGKGANMISGEKGNNGLIYLEVALSQIPRLLSLMDRKKVLRHMVVVTDTIGDIN